MTRGLMARICSLSSAWRPGDLCAQHDQVDVCDIEPAGDAAEEVVGRLGGVADVA